MELVIPDCSWEALEERLLGPACDRSRLQTRCSWLGIMKEHFRRFGLDYDNAVGLLRNPGVLKDVEKIGELVLGGRWVVLKCLHAEKADIIQKTFPIVYSLTTKKKSFSVTTEDMINLFKQPWKRDAESIIQHESVEQVESMKSGGLLFWEKINAAVPGGVKFGGYFDGLLKSYVNGGNAVIATVVHWKARPENEKLLGEIAASVGDVVAYYFSNYAKFLSVGELK